MDVDDDVEKTPTSEHTGRTRPIPANPRTARRLKLARRISEERPPGLLVGGQTRPPPGAKPGSACMREDAPVALEFADPARLAVDRLACPLGRRSWFYVVYMGS